MLKQYVKHSYHSSSIKISQSSPDSLRIQGPSNIQLWPLIQSLLSKNTIERVENIKSLWFLQSPAPNPQASPRVEANDRHKQAHPLSTCRKVEVETPEPIRTSLIPGEWRILSHSHPPSSRKFLT